MTRDQKREKIEEQIDSYNGELGQDMVALIALQARVAVFKWDAGKFITQFSESLGFANHVDTAVVVLGYLYPRNNTGAWKMWDKVYETRVKKSAWLKANFKNKQ